MCSRCGVIKEELQLGERMFGCEACGSAIDRDLNAANNIARIVFDPLSTVSSTYLREFKPAERRALAQAFA
jgi:putative transposase